jgi:riboflavin kinase/FMN adenylyltransferase
MTAISGKVISGARYGRQIGFPTANIDRRYYSRRKLKVKLGIYAGIAEVLAQRFKAGIVIGPLDHRHLPKIEAHLIGFAGNLYGKKITIRLQKYLRPFKKFKNVEQLKKQIAADIKRISKLNT